MMLAIRVLPRQNDDIFKNKVTRILNKQFHIPHGDPMTIVIYKPQGRPLDGIEENLSTFLRIEERSGPFLLIFVHDSYIPNDILFSLEREWDCKVFQWRNDADWKTICQYLEKIWKRKSFWDSVKRYVPAIKRVIFPLCSVILIYLAYGLYKKIIPRNPMPSPSEMSSPSPQPPQTSSAPPCSGLLNSLLMSVGCLYETMKRQWFQLMPFGFHYGRNAFV